jgi:hypothetical protein
MHHARIKIPVIILAVWCTASVLTLGSLKTVQADDALQRGEMVWEACMPYTEQDYAKRIALSEKGLSVAVCNVPKADMEDRSWSTLRPGVELQVPETLVRTLLMEETDGSIIELQVPVTLLFMLYTEAL